MSHLSDVEVGEVVSVAYLLAKDYIKERMLALGIIKGTKIRVLRKGPKNNLTVFDVRGVMLALRKEEAKMILVN